MANGPDVLLIDRNCRPADPLNDCPHAIVSGTIYRIIPFLSQENNAKANGLHVTVQEYKEKLRNKADNVSA